MGAQINVSEGLLNSGMKQDMHKAIMAFIRGLGFEDLPAALNALRGSIGTFNLSEFMGGVGEGIRSVIDQIRSFAHAVGLISDDGDARTLGRLAAELLGFSLGLRVVSPVITLLSGIASGFMAIKAAVSGVSIASKFFNLSSGLKALLGVETATMATGLLSFAGALGAIGLAVQGLISAGVLNKIEVPHDLTKESWDRFLWGRNKDGTSARPAWVDRLTENTPTVPAVPQGAPNPTSETPDSYWKRRRAYIHPSSYEGGEDPNNWRNLLTRASYEPTDSGDVVRQATVETARGVAETRDAVDNLTRVLKVSVLRGADVVGSGGAGFGGGGGAGGGNANLRYGRTASGGWNATPGTGSYGNPSKSLLDLIAKTEGAGYNVSWGNGKFLPGGKEQNLTGKSLNEILALGDTMRRQPGARNSSALGRYQITGSTLRDLMKRMGLNGSEKFDEAMQDRLASKLISDEGPRALQRWEGLKRGSYMAQAQALLRSGSIASQPGDVSSNGGGSGSAGKAVDIAMGMQGQGERSASTILGAYMHPGEWCADFVNATLKRAGIKGSGSAMAASFSSWGHHVDTGNVQKGDIITERHGNHVGHVGMATGNVQRDKAGNVTAVEMISGNYGSAVRKNWEKVGIIADLRRSNQAIVDTAQKLKAKIKTDSKASAAPSAPDVARGIHKSRQPDPAAVNNNVSADNSSTHHYHIHSSHDPNQIARAIEDKWKARNRFTDTNAYV